MSDRKSDFKEMCKIISDYSEDSYCAGWLDGVEFTVVTWLDELREGKYDPRGRFGVTYKMPVKQLRHLSDIAERHDMWPVWDDNGNSPYYDDNGAGPMPRTLAEARKARDDYRAFWDRMILDGKWVKKAGSDGEPPR